MATVNAAEMLASLDTRWVEASIVARRDQKRPAYNPIAQKFTIPSTSLGAGNIVRLWKFPAGAYILNWRSTPSDMDTNVSPALTYSIVVTDDADTVNLTLVSLSTNGQAAAGSDSIIAATVGRYVGNQWCAFKVGTASATAAAGTLKVFCAFALGVTNRLAPNRGLFLKDAEI
jgi:ribosomal protein L2